MTRVENRKLSSVPLSSLFSLCCHPSNICCAPVCSSYAVYRKIVFIASENVVAVGPFCVCVITITHFPPFRKTTRTAQSPPFFAKLLHTHHHDGEAVLLFCCCRVVDCVLLLLLLLLCAETTGTTTRAKKMGGAPSWRWLLAILKVLMTF